MTRRRANRSAQPSTRAPARVLALVTLAWLAGSLAACAGDLASNVEPATELCVTDDDCLSGLSCQFGICAESPGASYSIGLSITPPDFRQELAGQQVTGVPITLGSALPDYVLARPVQLSGIIAYDADDAPPVRADVRFRATSGIPGQTFATNVHTAPDGRVFSATLPPGIYDVTIIDDRPDVARVVRRGVNVGIDGAATGPCPTDDPCQSTVFIVPAPERYVRVDGTLTRRTPRIEPVDGARVFARSVDARYTSTSAVTGDDGTFSLLVPPVEGPWRIHVESDAGQPVPAGTFEPFSLPADATETEVALSFGELGDPVQVEGVVDRADGRPLVVTARAEVIPAEVEPGTLGFEGGANEVRVVVDAEADGAFALNLVPGIWTVAAAPVDASLGVSEPALWRVTEDGVSEADPIALSAPVTVTGIALAADRETRVAGATVEARFVGASGLPSAFWGVEDALWTSTTVTDDDGAWSLPLTRGTWHVTVLPPDGLGYGRWSATVDVGDAPARVDVALVEAGVVSGRILDEDDSPIAGARIAAWWIDDGASTLLDEAVTEDDGRWRLVLPTRLDPALALP